MPTPPPTNTSLNSRSDMIAAIRAMQQYLDPAVPVCSAIDDQGIAQQVIKLQKYLATVPDGSQPSGFAFDPAAIRSSIADTALPPAIIFLQAVLGTSVVPPRTFQYPYPTFPATTIQRYRSASDFGNGSSALVDTATADSPYGNSTAPQLAVASGGWAIFPAALTSSGPIDVSDGKGSIRINFRPVANTFSPSAANLRILSTTNPASAGSNYHQAPIASILGRQWTGATSVAGRWQSISVPLSMFTAVGTGANLSAIRMAQIGAGFGAIGFQMGDIEYVPNPRSKGAVIIRADDAASNQYSSLYPLMAAWGAQGMLMPSPISTTINQNPAFFITTAQWKEMMNAGWQSAAQAYSTEVNTIVDAWTRKQRMDEYANIRAFHVANATNHVLDTDDGSYYSNVGPKDMIAWPELRDSFRTLCSFLNGQGSGLPFSASETFPFGDRYNIPCLNISSWGDVADIYSSHLLAALEQTRACKGVLIIAGHNEWSSANFQSALNSVGDYVVNQFPSEMEFTTIRKLLAPYNGDPLTG